jgi:hypothetical protein
MANKPLREAMPETAAFVDEMRRVFGAESINQSIRDGMAGIPSFYASENGQQIGTKFVPKKFVRSDQCVVGPLNVVKCKRC